jgi:predicted RNA binding protein YcfA (HicA-like mRNA interferase family)
LSGDEVCDILRDYGFQAVRQRGSHVVMQRQNDDSGTTTVPVPLRKTVKRGTLGSITRQSGIPRAAFEE